MKLTFVEAKEKGVIGRLFLVVSWIFTYIFFAEIEI